MSAAMTYYTMLSLAPLLLIAITISGLIFEQDMVESEIVDTVAMFTTDSVAQTVASLISNATNAQKLRPKTGLITGGISLLVLLYGASGVFAQLRDTFNQIWQVPIQDRMGFKVTVKERLIGISMVLIAGILLLMATFLDIAAGEVSNFVRDGYPTVLTFIHLVNRSISFLFLPIVLGLLFWLIPSISVKFQDVWVAAMLTALLLAASRYLIDAYLRFSSTSELYGSAGSLVVLLIWVYMTGLVIFYGASFSHAWANTFGSRRDWPTDHDQSPTVR
jgi:membrane protein